MKLKNGEIFTAKEPLQQLIDQKFPVKTSYALAKLANKLNGELQAIEIVREGLIKKYGTKNKQGNVEIKPEDENWDKFANEFNELMEGEVEVVFEKVKIPEGEIEIEPKVLMALDKFVEV